MKSSSLVVVLAVIFGIVFSACPSDEDPFIYSPCVQELIDSLASQPVFNPPARVEEWVVDGTIYIYSTSDCCDQFNYLLDLECELICAPDGGFSGMGDGNCPDLEDVVKTLIWADSR